MKTEKVVKESEERRQRAEEKTENFVERKKTLLCSSKRAIKN